MPISSISNKRQSWELAQQTRRRAINQANQEEQKHSAIQAHHQVQPHPISRAKTPLQQVRKYQKHIKNNSLHSIEPYIPTEVGVPHNNEVERQEYQEPIKGKALEDPNSWNQWLDEGLKGRKLRDDIFSVLNAIEEGVEVSDGRY